MPSVDGNLLLRVGGGVSILAVLAILTGLVEPIEAKLPDAIPAQTQAESPVLVSSAVATPPMPTTVAVAARSPAPATARRIAVASIELPATKVDEKSAKPSDKAVPVAANSAGRLDLTSAERLSIKFQGYAELTGEYRINPDETISVPVVGRVSVSGMSAAELERTLAERASRLTGRETYITVEVAEYRPVFVTGFVNKPGAAPWKPGMTVLHAVTLLGGIYRPTSENSGGVVVGADNEIVRMRRASGDLKRVLAGMARLRAERADVPTITVPEKLVALVGKAEADRLIEEQTTALVSRRTGIAAQVAALDRAAVIAQQELAGLQEQSARLKSIVGARRDYKQKIEGLQAKGIVRVDRSMEEASKLSELEDRATTVSVGIARVQGTLAGLERDKIFLQQDRIASIDAEILKLDREVAQLELEIDSARSAYRKLTGMPAPVTFSEKEPTKTSLIEYEIVRNDGTTPTPRRVDQFAALRPGDILLVSTRPD